MHTFQIFISFSIFFLKLLHSCMTLSSLSFYSRSLVVVIGAYTHIHYKIWEIKMENVFVFLKNEALYSRETRKYLWKSRAWKKRDFMPAHSVLFHKHFLSTKNPFQTSTDHQDLIRLKNIQGTWVGWFVYCFREWAFYELLHNFFCSLENPHNFIWGYFCIGWLIYLTFLKNKLTF